jgi:hypothetical protein
MPKIKEFYRFYPRLTLRISREWCIRMWLEYLLDAVCTIVIKSVGAQRHHNFSQFEILVILDHFPLQI